VTFYMDASAAVKVVRTEAESVALRTWIGRGRDLVAGDLLRTELLRATVRGAPHLIQQARAVLRRLTLLPMSDSVHERAGLLAPVELRSLDALHLATALDVGDELEALITYDMRLSRAAAFHGIEVLAPS
jgi:predicted nucleic acid-binding protein